MYYYNRVELREFQHTKHCTHDTHTARRSSDCIRVHAGGQQQPDDGAGAEQRMREISVMQLKLYND